MCVGVCVVWLKKMTFSHYRVPTSIRKRERRLQKYHKWVAEVVEENEECRIAYYRAAKDMKMEQGDATFVHCWDWVRYGEAVAQPREEEGE
jgi:hypothetical protein